jgi:transcriptional regulator with XRE-family HTH domain
MGEITRDAQMTRAARIARLRREQGLTQVQMAEILGVSQQTIHSFEKGHRRVPTSALPTIARTLAVSLEELLGQDQGPSRRGPTPRLQRQLERLTQLPKAQQRFVSDFLDTVLQQTGR